MSISGAATDTPERVNPSADGFIPSNSDNITLFDDVTIDNLMHVVVALGAEIWTTRRSLFVMEALLQKAGVGPQEIENFRPSEEQKAAWAEERDIFIARTYDAFSRTGGANAEQYDAYRP